MKLFKYSKQKLVKDQDRLSHFNNYVVVTSDVFNEGKRFYTEMKSQSQNQVLSKPIRSCYTDMCSEVESWIRTHEFYAFKRD